MVYTLINNKELVEKNGQHSGGRGFVQTSRATRMARNIMGKFLLVANPGYVVYNIYGKTD